MCIGAHADGVALSLRQASGDLPVIMALCVQVQEALALSLKMRKCVVVPLDVNVSLEEHKRRMCAGAAGLEQVSFAFAARYLVPSSAQRRTKHGGILLRKS